MKKLLVLCAALVAGAAAVAQPSDKFTGALLWKISGKGLSEASYILGTHHLADKEMFDIIPGAQAALEASKQVVGELVLADMASMATQLQLASIMSEDVSYRTLLSQADYETLDTGLKGLLGVGMEQLGMFKPGAISLTISQVLFMKAYPEFNAAAHVAMDQIVQNFATANDLPVVGLETMEDQIAVLFEAEPYKIQAESLVCSIDNLEYGVESVKKLTALYGAGDLAGMYDLGFVDPSNPCPSSEEAKMALLKGRNDKWLEKLPSIFAEAPAFVAVGALHLAGEEGLLFRLDEAGYTVEAVE